MTVRIEPMTAADWPAVRRIYAEGIATGDATLEREAPDWDHFDRSHRPTAGSSRAARRSAPTARSSAGSRSPRTRRGASTRASPGRASTSRRTPAARASVGRCSRRSSRPREAAGFWTLLAGVLVDNAASLALHERVGFRRIGVNERIGQDVNGRWRDVVLLERRSLIVGR